MLRCLLRKNEALKKEWDKAIKKEDKKEALFNKKVHPIVKKYGFDFSFDDLCEYKKNSVKPQSGDGELSDDELFNVAGGIKLRNCEKAYNQLKKILKKN